MIFTVLPNGILLVFSNKEANNFATVWYIV